MLLTIDCGNTNITLGIFNEDKLISRFRITTKQARTSDEYMIVFYNLLRSNELEITNITDVVISSVVPSIMHSLNNSIYKLFKVKPLIVGPGNKTGIKINADNPKEVGADRIVNVTAAYHQYHKACLIIDFGTATTFDYVDDEGTFKYTIITPGIELAANALSNNAAKLPQIEITMPKTILATNTINGMKAGLIYGYIGQVEYIITRIKKELNQDFLVIATGGLGRIIKDNSEMVNIYNRNLAFYGMKYIYENTKKALK